MASIFELVRDVFHNEDPIFYDFHFRTIENAGYLPPETVKVECISHKTNRLYSFKLDKPNKIEMLAQLLRLQAIKIAQIEKSHRYFPISKTADLKSVMSKLLD